MVWKDVSPLFVSLVLFLICQFFVSRLHQGHVRGCCSFVCFCYKRLFGH